MKKVLSLVLAFAMILGSFGFVFASQYPDVKDTEVYSEPINVLSGLGVVGGFPDGNFQPDAKVNRAQMATMLVNALGIPVSGKSATKFSDVDASHWASGYVGYAANLGFVAGYPDGTFKPEKEVSYDEAITMIVAAIGYTADSLTGTWPGSFINQARGLGVLDTCKTTGSAAAKRADICCFLYDSLQVPMGTVNKDDEFVATKSKDGEDDTMLARLGAHVLDADEDGKADELIIAGDEDSLINLADYLGAKLTVYVNKDGEIVAIKEVKSEFVENTVKKIKKDYPNTDTSVWAKAVDYFKNGDASGSKKIDDFADADVLKIAVETGSKKVKDIFSIQAWFVDASGMAEDDVQDDIADDHKLLGVAFAEDDDDEIDMKSFSIVGRDAITDIAEDDVVYVYKNADGIAKIEVGTETVKGEVTKIKSGDYTIGGKVYGLSDESSKTDADMTTLMNNETTATFYLDYAGDIFSFKEEEGETSDGYGVVINSWSESHKGETANYVEIFLPDGTTAEYETDVTAPAAGTLVYYELDEDDVVTKLTASTLSASTMKISKNGVTDTKDKLASSTLAVKYSGGTGDEKKASKYSVVEPSKLFDTTAQTVTYILDGSTVKAMLYTGTSDEVDDDVMFVVASAGKSASGDLFTVLYKGEVEDVTAKSGLLSVDKAYYKLSFNDKDVITAKDDFTATPFDVADLDTKATKVDGYVFTGTDGNVYDLDEEIVVYVCDDDEWAVGKTSNLQAKKNTLDSLKLYNLDSDSDYDIALVVKK